MLRVSTLVFLFVAVCFVAVHQTSAQTTEFTYQGILKDGASPANGNYDLEFRLYDAAVDGSQIGSTASRPNVTIAGGLITALLDFGTGFPGANRFLEIRVRNTSGGGFTILDPRQKVVSSPYSIRSLSTESSANAVNADTANNALELGGVAANQYVLTTDPRMTDARDPLPGSPNYIQNASVQQASSNFNISGSGTAGGTLSANTVNAATQYNIGGSRILSNSGTGNLFAGDGAGTANTAGINNSFFGADAGVSNTIGFDNSFFGRFAGQNSNGGQGNSFFGSLAGQSQTVGFDNSFFGRQSGQANTTGSDNSFFGRVSGWVNTMGSSNSFFGDASGFSNTTGSGNTFVGLNAGLTNTTGINNTVLGAGSNLAANNLTFATAIGAGSVAPASNTVALGRGTGLDKVVIPGLGVSGDTSLCRNAGNQIATCSALSVPAGSGNYVQNGTSVQSSSNFNISGNGTAGGTLSANIVNAGTQFNIGGSRVLSNAGTANLFAGFAAGLVNTTGINNSFFGSSAGEANTSGTSNSFFGRNAGAANTAGQQNSFSGASAGFANTTGSENAFFGTLAGSANTTGGRNAFFGKNAGGSSMSTFDNAYFGNGAGGGNTTGSNNSFFGSDAGNQNITGSNNTMVGRGANVGAGNLVFATAIGSNSSVAVNNRIQLGRNGFDTVSVGALAAGTMTGLCINGTVLAACSSSRRYTKNIANFAAGLDLVNKLRPVTFDWTDRDEADLGLIAEEVEEVDPRLATYNEKGEIQGVKYEQLTIVLINAVKEQQAQITALQQRVQQQEQENETFRSYICKQDPAAEPCRSK